jgi:hypothetical protein
MQRKLGKRQAIAQVIALAALAYNQKGGFLSIMQRKLG